MKAFLFMHDDRCGRFETITEVEVEMGGLNSRRTWRTAGMVAMLLILVALVAFAIPTLAYAAGPAPQAAPIENSIFPIAVQILMVVLVTEGIKSLAKAFTSKAIEGREAAIAYVIVGLCVYATQMYLLPLLPANAANIVKDLAGVLALLLSGSGLYSMTSAFRVQS